MNKYKSFYICLRQPFSMLISGPSGSGKTSWVYELIVKKNKVCDKPPTKITYCYGVNQPIIAKLSSLGVRTVSGLPDYILEQVGGDEPEWLIIDDLMTEALNNPLVSDIFTKGSHHKNISIILLVQDFYRKARETRTISLNANYVLLFKNPRSKLIASYIAREMYPGRSKAFTKIYEMATREPYSYLFIDLKNDTPDEVRLLTNVLGEKKYISAFII